jgi:hypothetical protein
VSKKLEQEVARKVYLKVEIEDYEELLSSKMVMIEVDPTLPIENVLFQIGKKPTVNINREEMVRNFLLFLPPNQKHKDGAILKIDHHLSDYGIEEKVHPHYSFLPFFISKFSKSHSPFFFSFSHQRKW